MTERLTVDGPRPAVTWLAGLPRKWLTDRERNVMWALACDAYDGEELVSRPSGAALASWCGLINGRLYETLATLCSPNDIRPALLERVDAQGQPIPAGKWFGGRTRTGYRIRVEVDTAAALSHSPGTVPHSPASPGENGDGTLPANSPGKLSRETLPENSPGGPGDTLPYPSIPFRGMASREGRVNAREVFHDADKNRGRMDDPEPIGALLGGPR